MKKLFAILLSVVCLASCAVSVTDTTDTTETTADSAVEIAMLINESSSFDLPLLSEVPYSIEGYDRMESFGVYRLVPERYGTDGKALGDRYAGYSITAYPDYSSGGRYVTAIEVRDDSMRVFGTTLADSLDNIAVALGKLGFDNVSIADMNTVYDDGEDVCTSCVKATKNGITVTVEQHPTYKKLFINAYVTNLYGIMF